MSAQDTTQNGNGKPSFTIPTFGCKGCEERKSIMGAGSWQIDLVILAVILAGCFLFYKVKVA